MQLPLSWKRDPATNYHFEEGRAWLSQSRRGKRCTALAYAAFEFRLALERVTFQYWYTSQGETVENIFQRAKSFKGMQRDLFIDANQQIVDRGFEFIRIVLELLGLQDRKIMTPKFKTFERYWQQCSQLCHINWTIIPKNRDLRKRTFSNLEEIESFLRTQLEGISSWPNIKDDNFRILGDRFVRGEIGKDEISGYFRKTGLYAVMKYSDSRQNEFVGIPIEPEKENFSGPKSDFD